MTFRLPLFLAATLAFADNYPRQPGIDAQHYTFRVILSDDTDEITAEATATLRFVRDGVTRVVLDLAAPKEGKGMTVTSVTSGGSGARFTHSADQLVISLPAAPRLGEQRQFTVAYHGIAATGLHIAKNRF